jgi:hypothetical protein
MLAVNIFLQAVSIKKHLRKEISGSDSKNACKNQFLLAVFLKKTACRNMIFTGSFP